MTQGELKDLRIALRRAQREFETGRSMVEMLGVLAVIGVLSVAGIAGFKTAMDKHKANEIVRSVSIANNEMQIGNKPEFLKVAGAAFETTGEYQGEPAFVKVSIKDKAVCNAVKNLASGPWVIDGDCDK